MKLRDWKVRTKVTTGFAVVTLIAAFIIFLSMISAMYVRNNFMYLQQYPTERYITLGHFDASFIESRRIVTVMSFFAGDEATINALWNESLILLENTNRLMDVYRDNLRNDTRITPELRDDLIQMSYQTQQQRQRHFDEVVTVMYATTMANAEDARERIAAIFVHSGYVDGHVRGLLDHMTSAARTTTYTMQYETLNIALNVRNMLLVLSVIGVVAAIVISLKIATAITKPIELVAAAMSEVARGNLNVNVKSCIARDETGSLAQGLTDIVSIITDITDDLASTHHIYNELGNSKHRIDAAKYQNVFKKVVESINQLIEAELDNIFGIIDVLNRIGKGDFNIRIDDLPGDFIFQSQAIRSVVTNLQNVSDEVQAMLKAIANNGDLEFRIDTGKYDGEWHKIIVGLNRISEAVNAPLQPMLISLNEMKNGNMNIASIDSKIIAAGYDANGANYEGIFGKMTLAFDETLTLITSRIQ